MPGQSAISRPRPIIFGEVLFDCFDDGSEVLGGAPLNVAWHLRGLGLSPLLITRIGGDSAAGRVISALARADLDSAGVQKDPERPTGRVKVSVRDGQPTFAIEPGQAWDAIDDETAVRAAGTVGERILYHGTLALRSPGSKAALSALRDTASGRIFLDVNLRAPWWSPATVDSALAAAKWVKLNDDELIELAPGGDDPVAAASRLAARNDLSGVIVTRGAAGSFWADGNGLRAESPAHAVKELADTVGAGDAFAAVCIFGLENHWPIEEILDRAAAMAAEVCGLRGAVPAEQGFHARFLTEWR